MSGGYRNLIVVFKGGPDDKCVVAHQEANDALAIGEDGPLPNVGDTVERPPLYYSRAVKATDYSRAVEAWKKIGVGAISHPKYRVESVADDVMVCEYVGG